MIYTTHPIGLRQGISSSGASINPVVEDIASGKKGVERACSLFNPFIPKPDLTAPTRGETAPLAIACDRSPSIIESRMLPITIKANSRADKAPGRAWLEFFMTTTQIRSAATAWDSSPYHILLGAILLPTTAVRPSRSKLTPWEDSQGVYHSRLRPNKRRFYWAGQPGAALAALLPKTVGFHFYRVPGQPSSGCGA